MKKGKNLSLNLQILKNHQLFHTEEKPYNCNQCDKSFCQLNSLTTRHQILTREKFH